MGKERKAEMAKKYTQKIMFLSKIKYDSEIWPRVSKECEMCSLHIDKAIYLHYYL